MRVEERILRKAFRRIHASIRGTHCRPRNPRLASLCSGKTAPDRDS
jgi:hypothetical protein